MLLNTALPSVPVVFVVPVVPVTTFDVDRVISVIVNTAPPRTSVAEVESCLVTCRDPLLSVEDELPALWNTSELIVFSLLKIDLFSEVSSAVLLQFSAVSCAPGARFTLPSYLIV